METTQEASGEHATHPQLPQDDLEDPLHRLRCRALHEEAHDLRGLRSQLFLQANASINTSSTGQVISQAHYQSLGTYKGTLAHSCTCTLHICWCQNCSMKIPFVGIPVADTS